MGQLVLVEVRRRLVRLGIPLPDHPFRPNQGPRHRLWPGPRLPGQRRPLLLGQRRRLHRLQLRRRPGHLRQDIRQLSLHSRVPERVSHAALCVPADQGALLPGRQGEGRHQTVSHCLRVLFWQGTSPEIIRGRRETTDKLQNRNDLVSYLSRQITMHTPLVQKNF